MDHDHLNHDLELDPALDAVKARSARQTRNRRGAGAAAIVTVVMFAALVAGASGPAQQDSVDVAAANPSTVVRPGGPQCPGPNGTRCDERSDVGTLPASVRTSTTADSALPVDPAETTTTTTTRGVPDPGPSTTTSPISSPATTVSPTVPPPSTTTEAPRPDIGLDAAMERWASHRPARYTMTVRRSCFCPPEVTDPVTVTVDGSVITAPAGITGLTVDDIYADAAEMGPEGTILVLEVDPIVGYPRVLSLDQMIEAVDDEISYTITDFHPL